MITNGTARMIYAFASWDAGFPRVVRKSVQNNWKMQFFMSCVRATAPGGINRCFQSSFLGCCPISSDLFSTTATIGNTAGYLNVFNLDQHHTVSNLPLTNKTQINDLTQEKPLDLESTPPFSHQPFNRYGLNQHPTQRHMIPYQIA